MNWRDVARSQDGAISRRQLSGCGLTPDELDGLVRRRILIRQAPSVYVARSAPGSYRQQCWIAVLWSRGVLSHQSAGLLWRLPIEPVEQRHVTLLDGRRTRPQPGIVVHRGSLDRTAVVPVRGLRVTDRPTTIVDLVRTVGRGQAQELLDRSLQLGWLSEQAVAHAVRDAAGRPGTEQLRVLARRSESGARAESERRLHAVLNRAGLTGWIAQYRIRLPNGSAVVDVAFPAARLVIEVDGRRWHGAFAERFEQDRMRQNELVLLGWRVIRATWAMLRDQPDHLVRQVAAALCAL